MTKTTVTHEGTHHTFTCSLTSEEFYEDLVRLFCTGGVVEFCENDLHLYQVKHDKEK